MINFITLDNIHNLINGVIIRPLKVNKDESGILVETLKTSWDDVYNKNLPFAQCYCSVTPSGAVRDEFVWHVHSVQYDRFIAVRGDIITALADEKHLNLFLMGERGGDKTSYMVVIPPGIWHGFAVASQKEAVLLNYPTRLYSPEQEGRVSHEKAGVTFPDGTNFSWQKVIAEYKKL